jgi:hypothetical protein
MVIGPLQSASDCGSEGRRADTAHSGTHAAGDVGNFIKRQVQRSATNDSPPTAPTNTPLRMVICRIRYWTCWLHLRMFFQAHAAQSKSDDWLYGRSDPIGMGKRNGY